MTIHNVQVVVWLTKALFTSPKNEHETDNSIAFTHT